ncbi:N-acetyltransferase GCN5 [Gamsiella multidivaricata]|uniref:N-acetyltransferase GCN5 n=1 Tax=Gamsiella multidivaricata TaxID=101098 RepID=UPI00221FEB22|nr:N-acetyltransferase GCN5 [Gamsiella multidivaricata]KAG0370558.1 hypothetical protein BGZ54_005788 [Gamsiella multidivaricata]KAI7818301.1 N-acetyltransferase GCN5 [Gamsiella multidivaricata]
MNLRQAVPEDAPVLAELGALTFTHTFGHMYTPKDLQDFLTTTYTLEQHLNPLTDSRESFWLLEDDNCQALAFGWAGACKLPVPNLESTAGEIKRLYVHPDHQGKNLGSRILKKMLAWLEDEGFGPLYIGVWSENYGAQRLYARYGFEKVCEYEFAVGNHRDREFIFKRA